MPRLSLSSALIALTLVASTSTSTPAIAGDGLAVFSAQDALQDILASGLYGDAAEKLPTGYDLLSMSVRQSGEAPTNSFNFVFVYGPATPPPAGIHANCLIVASIASKVEKSILPGGSVISVSELADLAVDAPVCQH